MNWNPELEGKQEGRHRNGVLRERRFYQNGKINGKYTSWHDNGDLFLSEFFRDGLMEGESKSYYSGLYMANDSLKIGQIRMYALRRFYKNGKAIDNNFSWKKKQILLELKKLLYPHLIPDYNSFLICDLKNMI